MTLDHLLAEKLDCPICKRSNPADHRFCSGCGAKIHLPIAIGTVLDGRYRVVEVLSSAGGFATTYVAEDAQLFGRRQVLKELRPQMAEREQARALFQQEARILATLAHPGIPRAAGFFSEGERDYLVEDFVAGRNLGTLCAERGALSEEEVLRVLVSVLGTLEYLHGRTPPIVHRDVKPDNLILSETGQVVLVDFGAVRLASRPGLLTVRDGSTAVVYTQGYAPPEQILGHAAPASDLFALGATALHLLTGKHPQQFFDVRAGRHQVPAGLPPRLEAVVMRLTEPTVAGRYDHAGDVLRDLGYGTAGAALPVAGPGSVSVAAPAAAPLVSLWDPSGQDRGRYVTSGPAPRGQLRWEVRLSAPLVHAPTLWEGRLLVVTADRILHALDASNGATVWSRPVPGEPPLPAAPEAFGSRVILQVKGLLAAYDLASGELAWTHESPGLVGGQAPMVSDDRALCVDVVERQVVAFDGNGRRVWATPYGRKRAHADPEAVVRLDGPALATCRGNVVALAFKQTTATFRAADGAVLWTQEQPQCQDHGPGGGRRAFGVPVLHGRRIYVYSSWDCLYCLNAADGYLHWAHHTGATPEGGGLALPAPAVDGRFLYLAPLGWKLLAFSLETRERLWAFSAGGRPLFGPCLAGDRAYVATEEGGLYALDRETGEVAFRFEGGEAFVAAPLFADGHVYAGQVSGRLLALS
ncbi:MAG: PQQ-binding-like beta-propeller repeat protein [Candidatus Sericytochromatia bacterium]|nr:PQQ-binding-like beta-propeller repeat protein [Candidatus Tanganyikabacteria bacterium]